MELIYIKWEYKVVNISTTFKTGNGVADKIQGTCNKFEKIGYELFKCQSYDMGSKIILIFKRQKTE